MRSLREKNRVWCGCVSVRQISVKAGGTNQYGGLPVGRDVVCEHIRGYACADSLDAICLLISRHQDLSLVKNRQFGPRRSQTTLPMVCIVCVCTKY